ncbi:hypothetical protein BUALT_Bualt08G0033600 [Buddleja alternifolia]|uniref:Uncharacterized protein n=1 Tax=Buddleja alternifolia TaxID=168488 RepID=A0AAV6XE76_9LAMI|nr:hypothetical protein BUALT_Bualt08G0033600 [Buddleja alternifolia]
MGSEKNGGGVFHGNSVMNCTSSNGMDPFYAAASSSSNWDPIVSLNQSGDFGNSCNMVDHNEFGNHTMGSSSNLDHFPSHSVLVEMVPKIPSFGNGSFSETVTSFAHIPQSNFAQNSEDGMLGSSPYGKRKRKRKILYGASLKFLSIKLATVNPELNVDTDRILSKDLALGIGPGMTSSQPFLGYPCATFNVAPGATPPFHSLPQHIWNNELQGILRMGFDSDPSVSSLGQNDAPQSSQSAQGDVDSTYFEVPTQPEVPLQSAPQTQEPSQSPPHANQSAPHEVPPEHYQGTFKRIFSVNNSISELKQVVHTYKPKNTHVADATSMHRTTVVVSSMQKPTTTVPGSSRHKKQTEGAKK